MKQSKYMKQHIEKKKAVEILKEKRYEEYKRALIKEEQDESDEISTGILTFVQQDIEKRKNIYQNEKDNTRKSESKEDDYIDEAKEERLMELFEIGISDPTLHR